MMLTCLPQSLCSWNFRVLGATAPAEVEFEVFRERGAIRVGAANFAVVKHGMFSGHWSLEHAGRVVAEARKSLWRAFTVRHGDLVLDVRTRSLFSRTFDLRCAGRVVGKVAPVHLWTRRSVVEHEPLVPEVVALFCFWLSALTWRRAARRD